MKTLSSLQSNSIVLALVLILCGCSKTPEPEIAEIPSSTPAPVQPAQPQTPASVTAVVQAPAEPRLAPDGTFFLLRGRSIETPDGVFGLKPGSMVKKQPDGKYVADGHTLTLRPDEITNDLDIAAQIAGADARAQAAIRQQLQSFAPPPPAPTPPESTAAAAPPPPPSSTHAAPQRSSSSLGGSNLGGSSRLGATHTMTKDGWVWEKDSSGNWQRIRPLR